MIEGRPEARRVPRAAATLGTALSLVFSLSGCAGLRSEQHLAPVYTHLSLPEGGEDHEALFGSLIVRRKSLGGPVDQWGVRPFFIHYRDKEERARTEFLYPLGRVVRGGGEFKWWLLPIVDYRREDTPKGRKWSFLALPGIYAARLEDGRRVQAWFPFGGRAEELMTFDKLDFVLWPIWTRVERSGRTTNHLFWPLFSWTSAPDGGGWRAWPVAGHSWIDDSYDRWWAVWPVFNYNLENLKSDPEYHQTQWTVFPLYGRVKQGSFRSTSVLWPFFGYSSDPATGFWAWDGPWPLVRIMHPGQDQRVPLPGNPGERERRRFWPFYSYYRGDGLTSTWYAWPIVNLRSEEYMLGHREAVTVVPVWSSFQKTEQDGTKHHYQKLFPLYQYDRTGDTRSYLFPTLNFLWRWPDLDEHYSWLYELYNSRVGPETVHTRGFLGLYRREKDRDEDRIYVSCLWSQRRYSLEGEPVTENSVLFGLLRWRSRPSDGLSLLPPALPGPGWPIERVPSSLPAEVAPTRQ